MSKVSKMKLKDILKQTNLILRENDIIYFCDNIEIAQKFMKRYKINIVRQEDVEQFLLENEEHIDKEKLVLILILNYQDNLNGIREKMIELTKLSHTEQSSENLVELAQLNAQYKKQTAMLKNAIQLGKGIEKFLTFYYFDEDSGKYKVEVTGAEELINGKKPSNTKALKRFDEVDLSFKGGDETQKLGLEFILQSILLTDLYEVFPTTYFGNDIRTMILENEALKKGIITREELEELKTLERYEEYTTLIDDINFQGLLPDLKETLREYAQYINMDKLLLISAYRFYEGLENEYIDPKTYLSVKEILEGILMHVKNSNSQISCQLQTKIDGTYDLIDVTYSTKDIRECISRFTQTGYLKTREIEEYREKVKSQEINLSQIDPEYIDIIFSQKDLEKLSILSAENLRYVAQSQGWETAKIIELYESNKISLEYIEQVKEDIDLSGDISFDKLNEYYKALKDNPEDEEILNKHNRYLSLYKEVFINGKSKEEVQENSDLIIEKLVENLEGKEYNQAIKNYFREGILTLDSVAEWSNRTIITELFNEGLITLEDIQSVGLKLGFDYISNLYTKLACNKQIDHNERIKYLESGFVEEGVIIRLYEEGLILEEAFKELAKKAIIREDIANKIIENRTLEERIKNARAVPEGWSQKDLIFDGSRLKKVRKSIEIRGSGYAIGGSKEGKRIIDPNIRQQYVEKLGLYRIVMNCEEDSPFYHYEFYATPDEEGYIGANSVFIAERFYVDKDEEDRFATDNATYFFKCKDFLVLSNLNKSDMMSERENIVFRASHVVATENRKGTWAQSVLYGVLKTMLGSDLKDLTEKQKRAKLIEQMSKIYLEEEQDEIFKLCEEIDSSTEHVFLIDTSKKKAIKRTIGPNFDDSDDERI